MNQLEANPGESEIKAFAATLAEEPQWILVSPEGQVWASKTVRPILAIVAEVAAKEPNNES